MSNPATLIDTARQAIRANDHTDRGWDRAHRAIDQAVKATSDPTGMDAEGLQRIAEIHAEITNMACERPVCMTAAR
jgi:hypothetical protein